MNEQQMNTALTVARLGSLAKASSALFLSIQGVKDRIDSLERELGCTLFVRSSKGMTLTPNGKAFTEKAPALLKYMASFTEEVANPDAVRPLLRIQTPPVRVRIMDDMCREFNRRRPDVVVRFVGTSFDRMAADVRDEIADVGFMGTTLPDAEGLVCLECPGLVTRFKCVLAADDPTVSQIGDTVDLAELERRRLAFVGIHPDATPMLKHLEVVAILPPDPYETINFCQSGGACVCTEYLDTDFPQLRSVPIEGVLSNDGVFYRENPSREVLDFVTVARDVAGNLETHTS